MNTVNDHINSSDKAAAVATAAAAASSAAPAATSAAPAATAAPATTAAVAATAATAAVAAATAAAATTATSAATAAATVATDLPIYLNDSAFMISCPSQIPKMREMAYKRNYFILIAKHQEDLCNTTNLRFFQITEFFCKIFQNPEGCRHRNYMAVSPETAPTALLASHVCILPWTNIKN